MRNLFSYIKGLFFMIMLVISSSHSYASGLITFGPKETKIDGSVPYSVLGKYKAQFNDFKGMITLDQHLQRVQSVYLEIKIGSITSNCPWCDNIVKSKRLLNIAKYPKIIFKSEGIIHDEQGFKVKGILEMHGVKRRMIFPFNVEIINDQKFNGQLLDLKGSWVINRKEFNIIWNKSLDRGGVLVGDNITVNWGIKAYINND